MLLCGLCCRAAIPIKTLAASCQQHDHTGAGSLRVPQCTPCRPFMPEMLYSDTKTGKSLSTHSVTLPVLVA